MSTRQYIGARYVPKFFENSATNDSTWASNTIYEPLTIVSWNNNVYCSKKPVPANVGNPAENVGYWAAISFTSQQINEILEEIASIEANIDDIEDDISGINAMFPLGVLDLEHGGTGGTTAATARTNLDVPSTGLSMTRLGTYDGENGFDANNARDNGFHHCMIKGTAQHSPLGANNFTGELISFRGNGQFVFQIAFNGSHMFFRVNGATEDSWTAWKEVALIT